MHYASENGWTVLKDDANLSAEAPKDAKTEDTKTASLTKSDRELYKSFFEEDESLQSAYQEEGTLWGTNDNDNKRLQIETRAKAIYTNKPELGQLGALRKAVAEAGGTLPPAQRTYVTRELWQVILSSEANCRVYSLKSLTLQLRVTN